MCKYGIIGCYSVSLKCSFFSLKVETIGDAYMVVGGLPTPCSDHAERVASMACSMLEAVRDVHSPVDSEPIRVGAAVVL